MLVKSKEETKQFAKQLLSQLNDRRVVALVGDLGAGKTTFTQFLGEELGIKKRILSPTFVFIRSYQLKNQKFNKLNHVDLYRLESEKNIDSIGLMEILTEKNSLTVIEWPEIAKNLLPTNTVYVNFKKIDENSREITVS